MKFERMIILKKEIYESLINNLDKDELIELTRKLISIPSYHGLPNNEKEIGEYIYKFLIDNSMKPELIKVKNERSNVICGYGDNKDNSKTLMLNGHLDTVDVKNMIIKPFESYIENGCIFGRGSVDMKGAVAAMIMAVLIVKRAGIKLDGRVYFAGVIDEERGAEGTRHIIKNGPITKYAVVGEPSNLEIQNGHRGLEWIRIIVEGKYSHGGTPQDGINAIEKMNKVINEIQNNLLPLVKKRKHPIAGPANFNLGTIKGGTQPSTVPGDCILEIDRRYIPGESRDSVIKELNDIFEKISISDPDFKARAEIMSTKDSMNLGYPPLVCKPDSNIISSLKDAVQTNNLETKISYFPGWTDASLLSYKDVEAVVFGPGHLSSAHSDKEFCPIDDIINACKIYLYTIIDICK